VGGVQLWGGEGRGERRDGSVTAAVYEGVARSTGNIASSPDEVSPRPTWTGERRVLKRDTSNEAIESIKGLGREAAVFGGEGNDELNVLGEILFVILEYSAAASGVGA